MSPFNLLLTRFSVKLYVERVRVSAIVRNVAIDFISAANEKVDSLNAKPSTFKSSS